MYDGDHIALVFDGDGNQTQRNFHGPLIDQILAIEGAGSQVQWGLGDNLGTIRLVVNADGVVQNRIVYDSFGEVIEESNPGVEFRYGFTGRELDPETGLLYYRARYYDGERFISEDPIGFGSGDGNLYRYVFNSPLNGTDPSGLHFMPSFDMNDFNMINVNPEQARDRLRKINYTSLFTGFTNDLLQYALNQADSAPWGAPLSSNSVLKRVKIAPTRNFASNSPIARAIIGTDIFQDAIRRHFIG